MTRLTITKGEIILLGLLVLLTALIALVPWKELILNYREYESSRYGPSRAVEDDRRVDEPAPPEWRVKTEYSPETGALRLRLGHEYIKPGPDLWVYAQFTRGEGGPPVAETFLRNHSGGVYGADNLRLPEGEWIMSLTGIRQLEFAFRREEILTVE